MNIRDEFQITLQKLKEKVSSLHRDKKAAIFGSGSLAEKVYLNLQKDNFKVVSCFDNDKKQHGKKFFDIYI